MTATIESRIDDTIEKLRNELEFPWRAERLTRSEILSMALGALESQVELVANMETEHDEAVSDLESEIEDLNERISELEDDLSTANDERDALQENVYEQERENDSLRCDIEDMKTRIEELENPEDVI